MRATVAAVLLAALLTPSQAGAQACGPHDVITGLLRDRHGEEKITEKESPAGHFTYEVWVGPRTWTLLMTYNDGIACVFDFGDGWPEFLPEDRRT